MGALLGRYGFPVATLSGCDLAPAIDRPKAPPWAHITRAGMIGWKASKGREHQLNMSPGRTITYARLRAEAIPSHQRAKVRTLLTPPTSNRIGAQPGAGTDTSASGVQAGRASITVSRPD